MTVTVADRPGESRGAVEAQWRPRHSSVARLLQIDLYEQSVYTMKFKIEKIWDSLRLSRGI